DAPGTSVPVVVPGARMLAPLCGVGVAGCGACAACCSASMRAASRCASTLGFMYKTCHPVRMITDRTMVISRLRLFSMMSSARFDGFVVAHPTGEFCFQRIEWRCQDLASSDDHIVSSRRHVTSSMCAN